MKQSKTPTGTSENKVLCKFIKPNGTHCRSHPGVSGWCVMHDPARSEEKKLIQLRGAFSLKSMRIKLPPESEWKDMDLATLRKLISELIRRLASGELVNVDPVGKIGFLTNIRIGLENATNVEKRLEKLEEAVNGKVAK